MKIVEIVWTDAVSDDGHIPEDAVLDLKIVTRRNIGYLIKEDSNQVTIAFGKLNFEVYKYDHPLSIPMKSIESINFINK